MAFKEKNGEGREECGPPPGGFARVRPMHEDAPPRRAMKSVPVARIFAAEAEACGFGEERLVEAKAHYRELRDSIVACVKAEYPGVKASKIPEDELFGFVWGVFRSSAKPWYTTTALLCDIPNLSMFNCYSSSVLFANVLHRLGKPVRIVSLTNHVLLSGKEFAIETTAEKPEDAVFQRGALGGKPNFRGVTEGGPEVLLGIAFDWCADVLCRKGKAEEALAWFDRALEIIPMCASVWNNKGHTLIKLERYAEAMECLDAAIQIDPLEATFWGNKWFLHTILGDKKKALECGNRSSELVEASRRARQPGSE